MCPSDVEALNVAIAEVLAQPGFTVTSIAPEELERSRRSRRG
jgi:hypothetical protein